METLVPISVVAFGSALGGLARWGLSSILSKWFGNSFPYATLIVNLTGCLFLGWFMTVYSDRLRALEPRWIKPENLRLMIAVGFTGAYTTFSTFEFETNNLMKEGSLASIIYVSTSVFLGLLAVRLGIQLANT